MAKKQPKIAYAEFDSTCLDGAMFDAKAKTVTVTFARDGSSYMEFFVGGPLYR